MKTTLVEFLDAAQEYMADGISCLPLRGKKPAIKWKHLTERLPTNDEILTWWDDRRSSKVVCNIGMIMGRISGLIALDADDEQTAAEIREILPFTPAMNRTAKGIHLVYRIRPGRIVPPRVGIGGLALDVRGEASYIAAPPSIHPETRKQYRWLRDWQRDDLPFFDTSWGELTNAICDASTVTGSARIIDGPAYITHIRAISGQGGHNQTFRAACRLRDAGLSEAEALAALVEWNQTNAEPEWTVRELLHKIQDSYATKDRRSLR